LEKFRSRDIRIGPKPPPPLTMAYQSTEAKKEDFRKYLEKSNVIDSLTKVLVNLYEEPERPDKPMEFIKKALGGPVQADVDALRQENESLRAEVEALKKKLAESGAAA
jgi:hypothetical protein